LLFLSFPFDFIAIPILSIPDYYLFIDWQKAREKGLLSIAGSGQLAAGSKKSEDRFRM
jgi:hypothetical protein